MVDLTTIILTYNEELNIKDCIDSVKDISKRIIVVDSFSSDRTVQIAEELGAEVYKHKFINHAKQFKFGLDIADINTQWVFRIDADERLTEESSNEIKNICINNGNTDINGIVVRFEVVFLGKKLKHGGIYPFKKLLVFKHGFADIEDRNMDEHIYLKSGKSVELKNDSLHFDYKDLSSWIDKHNNYSTKEAVDFLSCTGEKSDYRKLNKSASIKRFVKYNIYYKLPMVFRPLIYFLYRYIVRLGFLDGKEGLIFAVLQAFWYRFLVDAKIYEARQKCANEKW